MAFVPTPSPTVVDQTTLMKKYLQFVAALTDTNTRKLFAHDKIVMEFFVLFDVLNLKEHAFLIRIYLHTICHCIDLFVLNNKV